MIMSQYNMVTWNVMSYVQVKVPSFQSRCYHSAGVSNTSPELTEVIIFGGAGTDTLNIANTTVLKFGKL